MPFSTRLASGRPLSRRALAPLVPLVAALTLGACSAGLGDCYDLATTGSVRVHIVAPYRADGDFVYDPDHFGADFASSSDPLCASVGDLEIGDEVLLSGIRRLVVSSNQCTQYGTADVTLPASSQLSPVFFGDLYIGLDYYDPDHDAPLLSFNRVDRVTDSSTCPGDWYLFLVPMGVRHGAAPDSVATPGELPPWLLVRQFVSFTCTPVWERVECDETWVVEVSHDAA